MEQLPPLHCRTPRSDRWLVALPLLLALLLCALFPAAAAASQRHHRKQGATYSVDDSIGRHLLQQNNSNCSQCPSQEDAGKTCNAVGESDRMNIRNTLISNCGSALLAAGFGTTFILGAIMLLTSIMLGFELNRNGFAWCTLREPIAVELEPQHDRGQCCSSLPKLDTPKWPNWVACMCYSGDGLTGLDAFVNPKDVLTACACGSQQSPPPSSPPVMPYSLGRSFAGSTASASASASASAGPTALSPEQLVAQVLGNAGSSSGNATSQAGAGGSGR